MKHPTYNGKQVIWESRAKQIWVTLVSFLFVIGVIWARDKYSPFMFWTTFLLFGGGGLLTLIQLLNPNNIYVKTDTVLGKQIIAEQFQKVLQDIGFFTYNDTGFNLTAHEDVKQYNWSDIETIFIFTEDRYSVDEICMEIFFSNHAVVSLSESIPGWYQFSKRLKKVIPCKHENWHPEVVYEPFATNMILLFDKSDRSKEQAEKACYGE